ncbi:MAG: hypothetical protein P4L41_01785 [Flavipsychrobacter sp.]|nr:hypothetical protein [Flavipsychrobacter sp.]
MAIEHPIIPEQVTGKRTDLDASVLLPNREEAIDCFKRAYKRLQNPGIWHELCGTLSAHFTLTDEGGNEVKRLADLYDAIKIDIPGPGTIAGGGYDWVTIEAVQENVNVNASSESFAMRLRASPEPGKKEVAHFFSNKATSTFIVERKGNTVIASYHGRNEVPNIDTPSMLDTIRNAVIAAGAFALLSEAQWSALMKALLQPEL